jgi:hypothetical protein
MAPLLRGKLEAPIDESVSHIFIYRDLGILMPLGTRERTENGSSLTGSERFLNPVVLVVLLVVKSIEMINSL